ncbi:MAG: hypothetical protein Fur0010_27680 [Bdellovibrio sp.]
MKKAALLTLLLPFGLMAQTQSKFIVKLRPGAQLVQLKSVNADVRSMNVSLGNFAVVELHNEKQLDLLTSELKSSSEVEYFEKEQTWTFKPMADMSGEVVQDAKFSDQWGLKNTGRNSGGLLSPGKAGEDINAEKVWGLSRGSKLVKIAVIDTGIDYNHPDLKANLDINEEELNGQPGIDDDGNGYVDDIYGYDFANNDGDPLDGHGHGTHCSGVIGAAHNRDGIRGVMANVKIFGVKFLSDSGSGSTEGAIKSIDYAIKRGANVMSNSWGGGGFSQALLDAIVEANDRGIVFVAAAGNSYANNDTSDTYPANYKVDNIISVGAMDGAGKKASFSNYGKKTVHVFAPGKNIISTVKNGGYQKMSGTSMACPHVSGIVGLLLSQEPNLSPKEVRDRVMSSAVRTSNLDKYTASGRADAYMLLK